jgi:hypothetical protein
MKKRKNARTTQFFGSAKKLSCSIVACSCLADTAGGQG